MPRLYRPTGMRKYRPFGGPGGKLLSVSGGGGGSSPTLAAYEAAVTTAAPNRWYKMDEASGNLINQGSDVVNNLILSGGASATYGETGYFDASAITPSATSYWYSATAFSYTSDITLAAFINKASAPADLSMIVAQYSSSGGSGGILLMIDTSGKVRLSLKQPGGGYQSSTSTASVCDGSWHLITARILNNDVRIFVDGWPVALTQSNPTASTYVGTSFSVCAQRDEATGGSPSFYYKDTIDDVLCWSRGLSNGEILGIAEAAGLTTVTQTADDFESYSTGELTAQGGWTQARGSATATVNAGQEIQYVVDSDGLCNINNDAAGALTTDGLIEGEVEISTGGHANCQPGFSARHADDNNMLWCVLNNGFNNLVIGDLQGGASTSSTAAATWTRGTTYYVDFSFVGAQASCYVWSDAARTTLVKQVHHTTARTAAGSVGIANNAQATGRGNFDNWSHKT